MKIPLSADQLDRLVKENQAEIDSIKKDLNELEGRNEIDEQQEEKH